MEMMVAKVEVVMEVVAEVEEKVETLNLKI